MKSLVTKSIKTLLGVISFAFLPLLGEQKLPAYTNFVNDYAKVLSGQDKAMLNRLLLDFQDTVGIEIAVVIEPESEYDVFDRALFIARGWKVGEKGINNGILIYLNLGSRKYHIVSADKTQGILTDAYLGDIGESYLVPYLKNADYYNAIRETTYAIALAVKGEFKGRKKGGIARDPENSFGGIILIILFILVYLIFIRRGGSGGYSRRGFYAPPVYFGGSRSGFGSGFGSSGSSGGFGGFGGGGGFNGGGAGGSW